MLHVYWKEDFFSFSLLQYLRTGQKQNKWKPQWRFPSASDVFVVFYLSKELWSILPFVFWRTFCHSNRYSIEFTFNFHPKIYEVTLQLFESEPRWLIYMFEVFPVMHRHPLVKRFQFYAQEHLIFILAFLSSASFTVGCLHVGALF